MKLLFFLLLFINMGISLELTQSQIEANLKKINGDATEYLMNKTFKQNGWKQIQGEIGNNGIDGLYIKTNKRGVVTDVLFGEAKYNTSQLGKNFYGTNTKNVKQMSKIALNNQIDNLIKKYPDNKQYKQIKRHLKNGNYRIRLFQLKVDRNFLIPQIKEIVHKGEIDIKKTKLVGNKNYKINNMKIDITNPKNSFEKRFVQNYKRAQINGLVKKFNFSAVDSKILMDKSPVLSVNTIQTYKSKTNLLNKRIANNFHLTATKLNSKNFTGKNLKFKTKTFWRKVLSKSVKFLKRVK